MRATELDKLPGIKQRELAPCGICGKGVAHGNYPLFWRVRVERFGLDQSAVMRQHGLELMLGSPVLAQVMGPDPDIGKQLGQGSALLCEECVLSRMPELLMLLAEEKAEAS